ncbi:MAG: PASTA domain-containing protein [Pontiellaceae bacterium]|jgi:hypothetical protein|nr:PASTA domain-containing protein [Pontiellaceae bacterium]
MNKRRNGMIFLVVAGLVFAGASFADSVTDVIYEAENAEAMEGVTSKGLDTGALGTGYVDFGSSGCYIRWNRILSDAGEAVLTFRYTTKSGGRHTVLFVNGSQVEAIAWKEMGSWTVWGTNAVKVTLKKGNNTIELRQSSAEGPNIDQMTVSSKPITHNSVPDLTGFSQADAESNIISAGMAVGTVFTEESGTVEAGRVIRQSPTGGLTLPIGSKIDLVVSRGMPAVG